MKDMLSSSAVSFDDPDTSRRYFEGFYSRQNDDGRKDFKHWLVSRQCQFQFREAAAAFKMIDDSTVPVIVRFGDADAIIMRYRKIGRPTRDIMRKLQRFVVNVYRSRLPTLIENGFIEELPPAGSGIYAQTLASLYTSRFGFEIDRNGLSAEECIV